MCFTIKERKILTATEDIVCYKYVRRNSGKDNLFHPLYLTEHDGEFCNMFRKDVSFSKCKPILNYILNKVHTNVGSIGHFKRNISKVSYMLAGTHSFKSVYTKDCIVNDPSIDIHVKCIIPKGAKYLENDTEYVSNKIKIVEVIN